MLLIQDCSFVSVQVYLCVCTLWLEIRSTLHTLEKQENIILYVEHALYSLFSVKSKVLLENSLGS